MAVPQLMIVYDTQTGSVPAGSADAVATNEVAAVRVDGQRFTKFVLHVTPSLDPRLESNCKNIWLFAVTAVVLTVVVVVALSTTNAPDGWLLHAAAPAPSAQFPLVEYLSALRLYAWPPPKVHVPVVLAEDVHRRT